MSAIGKHLFQLCTFWENTRKNVEQCDTVIFSQSIAILITKYQYNLQKELPFHEYELHYI